MFFFDSSRIKRLSLVLAVILAAYIGSRASIDVSNDLWYTSLNKSDLNPPGYVFGIVWPILYILMMISAFLSYEKIYIVFNIQLVLNAAWSWLFFKFQMPLVSLLDIYLLIALNIFILTLMFKESKLAFLLFIPYVVWISFASYLNLFIVINN
jgi:tryptophan-rich sensory protein